MGWSCSSAAYGVLTAWRVACGEQYGNSSNRFREHKKQCKKSADIEYFWEVDTLEHSDGAVTGKIWRVILDIRCQTGTFRINANGTIAWAPPFLTNAVNYERTRNVG